MANRNILFLSTALLSTALLSTALLMCSLLIVLGFAEFAARQIVPVNAGNPWQFRIPHPVLGWSLQPDADYTYKLPEERVVSVEYNSTGFRDNPHELVNNKEPYRILILGDSFMEAYSVNQADAFSTKLKERFEAIGKQVNVINMGVGGYGTLQEYLLFRDTGKQYQPDLVLLGFYLANDFRNNSFQLESLAHEAESEKINTIPFVEDYQDGNLVITQVKYKEALERYNSAIENIQNEWFGLDQKSSLVKLLRRAVARLNPPPVTLEPPVEPDELKDQYIANYGGNLCEQDSRFSQATVTTEAILKQLGIEVENAGAELIVFSVPAIYEVDAASLDSIAPDLLTTLNLCMEQALPYKALTNITQRVDLEYIDLLPVFKSSFNENGEKLFRYSDQHWNPLGHKVAADSVFERIQGKYKIEQ